MQTETNLLECWQIIYEKRWDNYAHSQEDGYNVATKAFLT